MLQESNPGLTRKEALHGAGDRLAVEHPDCAHDFPVEMRERAYRWLEDGLR